MPSYCRELPYAAFTDPSLVLGQRGSWATVRSQHGSVVMNPSRDLVCTSSGSPSPHPLSVPGSHQDPTWCLVVLPRFLLLLFTLSVSSLSGTTLTVLRSADQGSCRMSLSVRVTDVFLTTRLWGVGLRRPQGTCHSTAPYWVGGGRVPLRMLTFIRLAEVL